MNILNIDNDHERIKEARDKKLVDAYAIISKTPGLRMMASCLWFLHAKYHFLYILSYIIQFMNCIIELPENQCHSMQWMVSSH